MGTNQARAGLPAAVTKPTDDDLDHGGLLLGEGWVRVEVESWSFTRAAERSLLVPPQRAGGVVVSGPGNQGGQGGYFAKVGVLVTFDQIKSISCLHFGWLKARIAKSISSTVSVLPWLWRRSTSPGRIAKH